MRALFGPGGNCDEFRLAGKKSTLEAPDFVLNYGLDAYEYEAGSGLAAGGEMLSKLGKIAKDRGIKMSFHAPYFISLSGIVTEKRLKSIEYIRQSVDAAYLLGADTIVVHAGSCAKITREEAMLLAADTLKRTLVEVDTHGVKIGLETMGKINQLGTLDEIIDLCKIDSAFVPVVDFGHLNARDLGGVFVTVDDYRRVFDKISKELSPDIAMNLHCHFSKIEYSKGGEVKHLTFDDQVFGPEYENLCIAVANDGLTPTIICESAGTQSRDAYAMKKYYLEYLNK